MSLWVQPVHKVRGMWGPRGCVAGLVGIPWSWLQCHEPSPARAGYVLQRVCLLLPVFPAWWRLFWRQNRVYIPIFVLELEYF